MHSAPLAFVPRLTERFGAALQRVGDIARLALRPSGRQDIASVLTCSRNGRVSLVGAGPGDLELLTLKAVSALRMADVILFDQLVSDDILSLASVNAERIDVGKRGYGRAFRQSDINTLMVGHARAGRHVVRLKSGDPLMFGRLEEEVAALEEAGIEYAVVPGISAAQGAASVLRMGLTRRGGARRFQAITGHAAEGQLPDDFDWAGLADPKSMTAVYMPKATIRALCNELLRRGLPPSHPAVAVFNATLADQHVVLGSLATLPARIAAVDNGAPCIILIGAGAGRGSTEGAAYGAPSSAVRV